MVGQLPGPEEEEAQPCLIWRCAIPDNEQIAPNLSSAVAQQGVADASGGIAYSGVSDSSTAGEIAFQGPTADFILFGFINGTFSQGPPDSSANIEPVNNPLPYWYGPVNVSGGAVTCKWVADATSPSGQNLRMTFNAGAASDEIYFEQIVPVGGSRSRAHGDRGRANWVKVSSTSDLFQVTMESQYLTITGATTGSSSTSAAVISSTAFLTTSVTTSPATDAYFLRQRIGIKRATAGTTDSCVVDFTDVRRDVARPAWLIADSSDTATYRPAILDMVSGLVRINLPTSSTGFFINDGPVVVDEQAAPSTPATGSYALYAKTDGYLYGKNDGGTEHKLPWWQVTSGSVGSLAAGAGTDVTVTWPATFGDTNYTTLMEFSLNDSTNRNPPTWYVDLDGGKSATAVTIRVLNNAATTITWSYRAIGIHD